MRWLLGLPATALTASSDGTGHCAETARWIYIPRSDLLALALAGYAAEFSYGIAMKPDFRKWHSGYGGDMAVARQLVADYPHLRTGNAPPSGGVVAGKQKVQIPETANGKGHGASPCGLYGCGGGI